MEPIIQRALKRALTQRPPRRTDQTLYVSDLGKHPYNAVLRMMTGQMGDFDLPTLAKMDAGSALEDSTAKLLIQNLARPIAFQFPLFDEHWSGYADFVIGHGSNEVIIADHKGTAGRWWDYKETLPRVSDCCQVWMYGQLYTWQWGVEPELRLYYRGWGTWGEFVIEHDFGSDGYLYLIANGRITDDKGNNESQALRSRRVDPWLLALELEEWQKRVLAKDVTFAQLHELNPNDPAWDYGLDARQRLMDRFDPYSGLLGWQDHARRFGRLTG